MMGCGPCHAISAVEAKNTSSRLEASSNGMSPSLCIESKIKPRVSRQRMQKRPVPIREVDGGGRRPRTRL